MRRKMDFTPSGNKALISRLVLVISVLIFTYLALQLTPFLPDDSYISFRYAENLALGNGLTFNAGETPVEGYTNFLWILLCSLAVRLGLDLPSFVPHLGLFFGILNLLVFWLIIRPRLSAGQQMLVMLLLSSSGPFVLYSISGMETPLFSLLILIATLCVDRIIHDGRPVWSISLAVVCTLLTLCRPEGLLLYPAVVGYLILARYLKPMNGYHSYSRMRWMLAGLGLFALLVLVYQSWRLMYFGEIFPTPLLSKGGDGQSLLHAWNINIQFFFLIQNRYFAPLGYYYIALGVVALIGVLIPCSSKNNRPLFENTIFALLVIYASLYVNFVDWMPGMRYFVPLIPLLLIAGLPVLRALLPRALSMSYKRELPHLALCTAFVVLNLSFVALLRFDAIRNETSTQESLVALGEWLRDNVPAETLLAISDVGATPYYSKLATVDINPKSLTDIHIVKQGWSEEYFFSRRPGIVVLVSFSLAEPNFYTKHKVLVADPRFIDQYRLIGKTRYDWYYDRSYWVFAHKTLPFTYQQLSSLPKGVGN
ncbi:MAG: hypothetical protein ABII79_01690 [bacterium]